MTELILRNIKIPPHESDESAFQLARRKLKAVGVRPVGAFHIHRRSVDARKKNDIKLVIAVQVQVEGSITDAKLSSLDAVRVVATEPEITIGNERMTQRPVVVGFGPAGIFASLLLAENGYRPIVIERGDNVEDRVRATDRFSKEGILDTESNVQFGAGGAGTFSDGKLMTRVNDPLCAFVLRKLYSFGAPEEILHAAKPHIGTDVLRKVVDNAEKAVTALGGTVLYRTKMTEIIRRGDKVIALKTNVGEIPCGAVILAPGHSARDTYGYLVKNAYDIVPKDFSVGVRIEHLQSDIDMAMYGKNADIERLGHAEYQLSHREGPRGVYSFCMCPGGVIAAAASEEGGVVTNGMSYYARDGKNANSALAVSVLKSDYGNDPLAAIEFQRDIERKAFLAGNKSYRAPMQTLCNFLTDTPGGTLGRICPTYRDGNVTPADLRAVLPKFVCDMLSTGIRRFENSIQGFTVPDAVLTAPETRTSAPLRILRNEKGLATGTENLYPAGEGAGYAGGITSAAVDGMRCALHLMEKFAPHGKDTV